jgi:predicted nucleic acid-binding protein
VRIVLDTNVLISGLFFTGPPRRILAGWRSGRVPRILSEAILVVDNTLSPDFQLTPAPEDS